jgi:hypothetical protein
MARLVAWPPLGMRNLELDVMVSWPVMGVSPH